MVITVFLISQLIQTVFTSVVKMINSVPMFLGKRVHFRHFDLMCLVNRPVDVYRRRNFFNLTPLIDDQVRIEFSIIFWYSNLVTLIHDYIIIVNRSMTLLLTSCTFILSLRHLMILRILVFFLLALQRINRRIHLYICKIILFVTTPTGFLFFI